jgi:hypothetical protein
MTGPKLFAANAAETHGYQSLSMYYGGVNYSHVQSRVNSDMTSVGVSHVLS